MPDKMIYIREVRNVNNGINTNAKQPHSKHACRRFQSVLAAEHTRVAEVFIELLGCGRIPTLASQAAQSSADKK